MPLLHSAQLAFVEHRLHVPRYVARGDFTRTPYIVMERIEGSTLRPRSGLIVAMPKKG